MRHIMISRQKLVPAPYPFRAHGIIFGSEANLDLGIAAPPCHPDSGSGPFEPIRPFNPVIYPRLYPRLPVRPNFSESLRFQTEPRQGHLPDFCVPTAVALPKSNWGSAETISAGLTLSPEPAAGPALNLAEHGIYPARTDCGAETGRGLPEMAGGPGGLL